MSSGTNVLKVKNLNTNEIRRINVPAWPTLSGLDSLLHGIFGDGLPKPYYLQYLDDDGDKVSITTSLELEEAIDHAKRHAQSGRPPVLSLQLGALQGRSTMRSSLLSSSLAAENLTRGSSSGTTKTIPVPKSVRDNVQALFEQGYHDPVQNIAMLIKHGGNVSSVIEDFVEAGLAPSSDPNGWKGKQIAFPPKFVELVEELQSMGFANQDQCVEALLKNGAILNEATLYLIGTDADMGGDDAGSSSQKPPATTTTTKPKQIIDVGFTLPDSIQQACLKLESLGFKDRMHNIEVLIKFGGNEQEAILQLTQEQEEIQLLEQAAAKKEAERKAAEEAKRKAEEAERKKKEQEALASVQLPKKFQKNLLELHRMGFEDMQLNSYLLIQNGGDLQATIQKLIENSPDMLAALLTDN